MQREILEPRWEDPVKKDVIIATFRYTMNDGTTRDLKASISNQQQADGSDNPDWLEVMETVGEEVIDSNTTERENALTEHRERQRLDREARRERILQEQLFNTKLELFEIDRIQNLDNIESKRNIRRSENQSDIVVNVIEALIKDAFKRSGIEYNAPAANTDSSSV